MGKKIKNSLTFKIFLSIAGILLVSCLLIYAVILVYMPQSFVVSLSDQFTDEFAKLESTLSSGDLTESKLNELISSFSIANNAEVDVKLIIEENPELAEDKISVSASAQAFYSESIFNSSSDSYQVYDENTMAVEEIVVGSAEASSQVISLNTTVLTADGTGYYVTAITSLSSVDTLVFTFQRMFPPVLLLILLISFAGAFFYSHFLSRPVIRISSVAKELADLNLSSRCEVSGSDEVGLLAASINDMAENLENILEDLQGANEKLVRDIDKERKLERQRREFFASVSHELKTPITVLKGELEGMIWKVGIYKDRDEYLRHAFKTTESMENLVRELMTVSKMESDDFKISLTNTNLSKLVHKCCSDHKELNAKKKLSLDYDIEDDVKIMADSNLLKRAVSNVISNAFFHSPLEEHVTIRLKSTNSGFMLDVENTGVHLDDEHLERIFEPFYRVEKSRSRHHGGSGLGLYIVKTVLDLHEFQYEICNSQDGVRVQIWN